MIVFTAALALIIGTVVVLAVVTIRSGSIHTRGDHFVSSLTESRHQTMVLRLDRDRLAGEPIQRSLADVLHRVSRPVITMPGRTGGVITRNSASTNVPVVARKKERR